MKLLATALPSEGVRITLCHGLYAEHGAMPWVRRMRAHFSATRKTGRLPRRGYDDFVQCTYFPVRDSLKYYLRNIGIKAKDYEER